MEGVSRLVFFNDTTKSQKSYDAQEDNLDSLDNLIGVESDQHVHVD